MIVLIFSCKPCPDCPEVATPDIEEDDTSTATLRDTISVNKYNLWKNNWNSYGKAFTANTLTEYFTMPLIDLEEFLYYKGSGRDTIAASRFVLGLEIDGTDTTQHIMLVGVDSDGKSMTDATKQQYVYDVSKPCPHLCGSASLPNAK